jgi:uncharacterized protein YndB with AHSA1/START domain
MSENITVSRIIPARAPRLFDAWLSAEEHGRMVGAGATVEPDGHFTAWDGYIQGRTLEQQAPSKIVQSWRTTEFPEEAPDSIVTISFEPDEGGTKVTIEHENIPEGQGQSYATGWNEHYFEPMTHYFSSAEGRVRGVGEALGHALGEAEAQVGAVAQDAIQAVATARKKARKRALQTIKAVKKVRKQAVARAKAVGKKVKALVQRPKKVAGKASKAAPKKASSNAGKKAIPTKVASKKAAPKKTGQPPRRPASAKRRR